MIEDIFIYKYIKYFKIMLKNLRFTYERKQNYLHIIH